MDNLLAMSKKRKVMRLADDDKLDQALYLWFVHKRGQNLPGLCEKAMLMLAQIHAGESAPPFQASRGWLWRFCNHHGIRRLSLQGEKLSSDTAAVEPFKKQLQEFMEKENQNLYNCDETATPWYQAALFTRRKAFL